jgi:hypothetical protein
MTSVLIWMVFMGMPSLSKGCILGVEAEPRWRELEGVVSWASCPVVVLWANARAWSFSNAETLAELPPRIMMMTLSDDIFRTRYP